MTARRPKKQTEAERLGMDPKVLEVCRERGIDPVDLLDCCRERRITQRNALECGKYWRIWKRGKPDSAVRVWAQTAYEAWRAASGRLGAEADFPSCVFETGGKVVGDDPPPPPDPKPAAGQRLFIYHAMKGPVEAKRQPDRSKLKQLGPINTSGVGRFMLYEEKLDNGKPVTWAVRIKDKDDGKKER